MTQTFEQWRDDQGFPVTSTQEPLWRRCWDAAQTELRAELDEAKLELHELRDDAHTAQTELEALRCTYNTETNELRAQLRIHEKAEK